LKFLIFIGKQRQTRDTTNIPTDANARALAVIFMKHQFIILAFLTFALSSFQYSKYPTLSRLENWEIFENKISILILPPFDEIANGGMSPDIQKMLEEQLSRDFDLSVIKFPYKKLMNVPYQNVFDKKYCKPILEKVHPDVIIMTKIDHITEGTEMEKDKWDLRIRFYFVKTNKQVDSKIIIDKSNWSEIKSTLLKKHSQLVKEVKNNG
jgi:hypothetical protein